jgi:hypothetical protein
MLPILQCKAQTSGLTITHEEYQWTDDMKRLGITTPERGLIFKITIFNDGTKELETDNLVIDILVSDNTQQYGYVFNQQINFGSLYLPPKSADYRFVKVTQYGGIYGSNLTIGSYTAKLTYTTSSNSVPTPIEQYPFNFRVVSEEELQKEIGQNPINIYIIISVIVVIIVVVALLTYLIYKRRKKQTQQVPIYEEAHK